MVKEKTGLLISLIIPGFAYMTAVFFYETFDK
jgi:hypothetical protein